MKEQLEEMGKQSIFAATEEKKQNEVPEESKGYQDSKALGGQSQANNMFGNSLLGGPIEPSQQTISVAKFLSIAVQLSEQGGRFIR